MNKLALFAAATLTASLFTGCSNYRDSGGEPTPCNYLNSDAQRTIENFKRADPTLSKFFDRAYAYAVFPTVAKGGFIAGAASGEGVVYMPELGQPPKIIGYSTLTQITVGAQIGGQSYSEIVFIQDAATLSNFRIGDAEFAANASAVIAKSGAGATNDYNHGLAVFVQPKEGVMAEAAIGGQSFKFRDAK